MPRKLYVANLSDMVGRDELQCLFAGHGTVRSVEVIVQHKTASGTETGLVEMESEEHGEAAIAALNDMRHRGFDRIVGWARRRQDTGLNDSRMFESMNTPDQAET